jgi:hypothetical protein
MKYNLKTHFWTYISGSYISSAQEQLTQSKDFSVENIPQNRFSSGCDQDGAGNLYMFGGLGVLPGSLITYPQDLWVFNVSRGGWAKVFSAPSGALATYVMEDSYCTAATPGDRDQSQIFVNQDGTSVYLYGGYDIDVWWDYSDLWHFARVNESKLCPTSNVLPSPSPAPPVNTRRPRRDDRDAPLSAGAIAGIVVVVLFMVIAVFFGVWFLGKRIHAMYGHRAVPQQSTPEGGGAATTTYEYPTQKMEFATFNIGDDEEEGGAEPSSSQH